MTDKNIKLDPTQLVSLIGNHGQLSRTLKGFEPRLAQQQMMANIIEAYNKEAIALIEAGTGTGKSLAYLIPAILWASQQHEKTVISTHTIALQEQLIEKDIPSILKALNLSLKTVLVKGMSNYLCFRKIEDAQMELQLFPGLEQKELDSLCQWLPRADEGSRSEIPFIISPATWERVGAEADACSHNDCPHFQKCFFFKARRKAQDAHLLIANHHLLFADLAKRKETNNYSEPAILPSYNRIIIDEAHHIESIATEFFSARLHKLELLRILGRLNSDKGGSAEGKLPLLREKLQSLYRKTPPHEIGRLIQQISIDLSALRHTLNEQIHESFEAFCQYIESKKKPWERTGQTESSMKGENKLRILKEDQIHSSWKEQFEPQAMKLIEALKRYHESITGLEGSLKLIDDEKMQEQTKSIRFDIVALSGKLLQAVAFLGAFLEEVKASSKVRWIELQQLKSLVNVHLIDAELNTSKLLADYLFNRFATIVLCSATLATNQKFDYTRQRLGLTQELLEDRIVTEHVYTSPFDYKRQTLLAIPTDMPPPSHPAFNDIAFENVWKAVETTRGGVFVLFTSYAMMQACHAALAKRLSDNRYTLFRQGDDHRLSLLNNFRKTDRAVLFGTDTFWEGVDVAGDALRCVIIVKLPFQVPNDPMVQAHTEAILESGGNPFNDYMVPHAIVKFKQGFGRLIRSKYDRGCVICLDTRLALKGYGQQFLNSLPASEKLFMNSTLLWP
jgi:ATP-dependent DNA helicase DinG